jgi:hypothetical protein
MRTYSSTLDEVASNEKVLLIRRNLDIVRSNDGLVLIGIIKTLDVIEVRDIESGDVVTERDGEVSEFSVVGDVGVDGEGVLGFVAEIVEEFGDTLVALGVLSEGVDDPDLARTDSTGDLELVLECGEY